MPQWGPSLTRRAASPAITAATSGVTMVIKYLHDHNDLLYLFDNDIDHYEMTIQDWDHAHGVLRQDYDLDYTIG